jgi:hypothetical protein
MPMKDCISGRRVGTDVLLAEIPSGFVGYRKVGRSSPTADDFRSHYELGILPNPAKPYRSYAWFGVSLFEDEGRAERLANTARRRGESAWVARLRFNGGTGLYGVYNPKNTHLEVFAIPQDLLALIDQVI